MMMEKLKVDLCPLFTQGYHKGLILLLFLFCFVFIGNLPCFTQQRDHDQMIEFAPVPMGDLIKSFKNV